MVTSPLKVWQPQFRVNTNDLPGVNAHPLGTNQQSAPYVLGLAGGGFVIAYEDWSTNFGMFEPRDILAQSYDISGAKLGGESYVSQNWADGDQWRVSLTQSGSGYIATFGSTDGFFGDADNIYGTLLSSSGSFVEKIDMREGLGDPAAIANQRDPFGIRFTNGNYAVFYTDDLSGDAKIMLKVRVATDVPAAPYAYFTTAFDPAARAVKAPEAAALALDNWIVAYESAGNIRLARGNSFTSFDAIVSVAATARDETDAQVAVLKNGAYVVSWTDADGDGAGNAGIKARLYSPTHVAGATFTVNDILTGKQSESDIAALKDGGFVIAWRDEAADTIRAQQYSATGAKVGTAVLLASGGVDDPSLGVLNDGRVVLSYTKTVAGNSDVMAMVLDPRLTAGTGTTGSDVLVALATGSNLSGLAGDDVLVGSRLGDTLAGGAGVDILRGNDGADRIIGGAGRDDMSGGAGADRFVFVARSDSPAAAGTSDLIRDFAARIDKIDLFAIDAIPATTTLNDAFRFVATQGKVFTGVAGQLRWWQSDVAGTADDRTFVAADLNGDKIADFRIELVGLVTLAATDFIL